MKMEIIKIIYIKNIITHIIDWTFLELKYFYARTNNVCIYD